ncbi:MAG: helix-turn-helix transcriptional regulator [Armatimonadetes bacterium]|nr:helix-turn-helix transcriptional regulator [Armatimonadota bacterium]
MNNETFGKACKALGDPTRLQIIGFLSTCCCAQATIRESGDVESPTAGQVCCHVTGAEKINSTISHHLHELEAAGLIRMEKRGTAALCRLNQETLLELASYATRLASGENHD